MKTLILILISSLALAKDCTETTQVSSQDVVHNVNTSMPKHLKGAMITVTLADGKSSQVPAERFMVVPRKQQTVVGQDKTVSKQVSCKSDKKNLVIADLRKDVTGMDTETSLVPGGVQAKTRSERELVPGINYFRRQVLDSDVGLGVGVDTNGTVKGMLGVEF